MRVSEIVRCGTFPCADVRPGNASIILISESTPADLDDYYYNDFDSLSTRGWLRYVAVYSP